MGLSKHFFILLSIFLLQLSLPRVTASIYLHIVERDMQNTFDADHLVYHSGEYAPLFLKHVSLNNHWKDEIKNLKNYYIAVVKKSGNFTDEIFYTRNGKEKVLRYKNNEIIMYATNKDYPANSMFIFPFFALIVFAFGAISYHSRTGTYTTFAAFSYDLNENENILRLYGLGIFFATILAMAIQDKFFLRL